MTALLDAIDIDTNDRSNAVFLYNKSDEEFRDSIVRTDRARKMGHDLLIALKFSGEMACDPGFNRFLFRNFPKEFDGERLALSSLCTRIGGRGYRDRLIIGYTHPKDSDGSRVDGEFGRYFYKKTSIYQPGQTFIHVHDKELSIGLEAL